MSRRSRRNVKRHVSLPAELDYRRPARGRVLSVSLHLPRPIANLARREIYTYPFPKPMQKRGRVIRVPLRRARVPLVKTKVRIRLPRHLPLLRGSMVSLADNRLNIHSYKQLRSAINAQEFNRRRYSEYKRNKRKASHGQLDSRGSQRFGSVAHAYRRGDSIDKIAEVALAVRAISQGS